MIVITEDWKGHLHVNSTNQSGVNMQRTANAMTRLEFTKCYNALEKIILGSPIAEDQIPNKYFELSRKSLSNRRIKA